MLQNIIVFLIVAAAAAYLGRMLWIALSGKKGCGCGTGGGCSKAAATPQQSADALIQISLNGRSGASNGVVRTPMNTPNGNPSRPSGAPPDR
ncbi:MAG TPA: hypothetical protein VNA16_04640 [Abditibacteriaceae bacterium]|nr:hypothetical protein [Abditibacteriaceae bacterium]